jgi:hypothetical protein
MNDDLIARLEAAPEGSRELDVRAEITRRSFLAGLGAAAIAAEIVRVQSHIGFAKFADAEEVPHYTTSLDAALTLVPEGWRWKVQQLRDGHYATLMRRARNGGKFIVGPNPPALALCIAALRARTNEKAADA